MPNNPGDNREQGKKSPSAPKLSGRGSNGGQSKSGQGSSGQPSAGKQSNVRLQLTPEQQAQVRRATGRDASSLELSVHEIEDSLDSSGSSESESGARDDESSKGSESEF